MFVLIAALIITLIAVMIGHYLRDKAENANMGDKEDDFIGNQIARDPTDNSESYNSVTVFGAGITLTSNTDTDEVNEKISELSQYYNTLNITVTDENGNFLYSSPALCELFRVPVPEDNQKFNLLSSAITAANALGMNVCIVMAPSDLSGQSPADIDAVAVCELVSLGADEVLIMPKPRLSDYIDYNTATKIRAYFNALSDATDKKCSLGIVLPVNSYRTASNAKQLQMIASAVNFMAIDLTAGVGSTPDENSAQVGEHISALLGTFRTYNMRVLLCDTDPELLAAAYSAAVSNNINNISFTSGITPDMLTYTGKENAPSAESDNGAVAESSIEDRTNPYANVADSKSENETESSDNRPWY